jgi:hypothetical protein
LFLFFFFHLKMAVFIFFLFSLLCPGFALLVPFQNSAVTATVNVGACRFVVPIGMKAVDMETCRLMIPYCKPGLSFDFDVHVKDDEEGDSVFMWQTATEFVEISLTATKFRILTSDGIPDDFFHDASNHQHMANVQLSFHESGSRLIVQINSGQPRVVPLKPFDHTDWINCFVPVSRVAVSRVDRDTANDLIWKFGSAPPGWCQTTLIPLPQTGWVHRFYTPTVATMARQSAADPIMFAMSNDMALDCQYAANNAPTVISPLLVNITICEANSCTWSQTAVDPQL